MVRLKVTQKSVKTSMEVMVNGTQNEEGGRILGFCTAVNMTFGKKPFQKRASHLVTYKSSPSKAQANNYLVRRNQRK